MAKFTENEDGTFTISIPDGPEVYDAPSGTLTRTETLSEDAFERFLDSGDSAEPEAEPEAEPAPKKGK
jgi:hypothetical protein